MWLLHDMQDVWPATTTHAKPPGSEQTTYIHNVPLNPLWTSSQPAQLLQDPPHAHVDHVQDHAPEQRRTSCGSGLDACSAPHVSASDSCATPKHGEDATQNDCVNAPSGCVESLHPRADGVRNEASGSYLGREGFRRGIRELASAAQEFWPDLILISAGFDGAFGDEGNCVDGVSGSDLLPEDYAFATEVIGDVAKACCNGRIVSVLEGGYGSWDDATQAYDRGVLVESCVAHVRALAQSRM
jgi:hypothetical protein